MHHVGTIHSQKYQKIKRYYTNNYLKTNSALNDQTKFKYLRHKGKRIKKISKPPSCPDVSLQRKHMPTASFRQRVTLNHTPKGLPLNALAPNNYKYSPRRPSKIANFPKKSEKVPSCCLGRSWRTPQHAAPTSFRI